MRLHGTFGAFRILLSMPLVFAACLPAIAQLNPSATWAVRSADEYRIQPDLVYGVQNNFETKLDVYQRRDATGPQPTVIFMHGGGWVGGSKEASTFSIIPWLEMGWNVVNVEYRLARVSGAPAALEDCMCALRWVGAHAKEYNIDLNRLVTSGESAGGHLALALGMIPASAGFDRECPGPALPKVAAIVNWYGPSDVTELLTEGPHQTTWAVQWFGSLPYKAELAKQVSPIEYVRPGQPPVIEIHGDADPAVPYAQATRLQEALAKANVPHELVTIPNGKHGNFTPDERIKIYVAVRDFLTRVHVMN
jgi:acetyl esterase/lipase